MVIKNRKQERNTLWHLNDGEPLPRSDITVSLKRWQQQHNALLAHPFNIGIRLSPDDELTDIVDDLDEIDLVTLDFTSLTDGRGYSQARKLRVELMFNGEIRALGADRDNLSLLERCGVDAFECRGNRTSRSDLSAFDEISF